MQDRFIQASTLSVAGRRFAISAPRYLNGDLNVKRNQLQFSSQRSQTS